MNSRLLLKFLYDALNIPATGVEGDDDPAFGILTLDLIRSFFDAYICQLIERQLDTAGSRHQQLADAGNILPSVLGHPHDQIEAALILVDPAGHISGEGCAHQTVHLLDGNSV